MVESVTVRAPAKINLHLGVGPVRADGYHPLSTVYQAVSLYDDVTVSQALTWSVELAEADPGIPLDDTNLAVRAGQALVTHHGLDRAARIAIHKGIPVAGGMAGGSADAAATLVALDRLWDLRTRDEDLMSLAADLGSDVPFALIGGTALGSGRGEVVDPVEDRCQMWWTVVPQAEGLSTPEVYRRFDDLTAHDPLRDAGEDHLELRGLLDALADGDPAHAISWLGNDLELAAYDLRPDLIGVRARLAQISGSAVLLSGSGPTHLIAHTNVESARETAAALGEDGIPHLTAHGPVAGAHVVSYG